MQSSTGKVFVTGGNGFLGSRTVEELLKKGYSVRCLLREQSDLTRIQHLSFEIHRGDIRDRASLIKGAEGCDAIIHLAGISSWEQIRSESANLNSVIVEGTRNILEAAREMGVKRTVVISTTAAVNGSKNPKVFNEKSAYGLSSSSLKYSQIKRKAERLALTYSQKQDLDVVVVNPCEVYGAQDTGMVTAGNLIHLLGNAPAVVCSGGTAVAHVDDVARGIVLALEKGKKGERYILGGENVTLEQIARIVRKLAGKSEQVITLPNPAILALCKTMALAQLTPPVSLDVLEYASLYWFVDSSKAKKELGYESRPSKEVFADVVKWLIDTQQVSGKTSIRYGGGSLDARSAMIRLYGALQRKKIVILDSNPKLCGEILASSDTKGTFLEHIFATPSWHPIYSIESMDGERWEQLSRDFKKLLGQLGWREKLTPLTQRHATALAESLANQPTQNVDSEAVSRLVVKILFELLFDQPMSLADETLFYRASIEWRKEIAVKGKADEAIKNAFWCRLTELVALSSFKEGLESYKADPSCWLSLFAQPFLISPQINISDIFVTVFHYLGADSRSFDLAKQWARAGDRARLDGLILESIRLKHPFPILERELKKDITAQGKKYAAGTQFFILLDQFKQDSKFDPERWLQSPSENPYYSIPFAAGPRMCIGKPIAMELLSELLKAFLLQFPQESIQPAIGHLYSGRNNDGKETQEESRYQTKIFSQGLLTSLKIGLSGLKPKPSEAAVCPFKKLGLFS